MNRKAIAVALLLAGFLCVPGAAADEGEAAASSTVPPRDLKKVGDHWTPWAAPQAGPNDYIIQERDTLWDLAGKWLQDPHLWPQVWDQNRYILDSHWIYPGDPLVIPAKPTVVEPGGPPAAATPPTATPTAITKAAEEPVPEGGQGWTPPPKPVVTKAPPAMRPVADPADLYCSGYIDPDHQLSPVLIVGREMEREFMGQGDVVYLNQGRDQGRKAGDQLAVIRADHGVVHPATGQHLGSFVRRMGHVRILATQEHTSTAVIDLACEDIHEGDELVPWGDIPAPMLSELPAFDRYDAEPKGGVQGYVVDVRDQIPSNGTGHVIFTDLGAASGVKPGDTLLLFRPNDDLPRLMIGQGVVLTVEPGTSTVKIVRSVRELAVGDRVEATQ
jgi:hypothetical protein